MTQSFIIKYQKAYDFKTSFITGVLGGLSNNGLINASFFADRAALPDHQEVEIGENNSILKAKDIKENDIVRDVQFGCYMDINTAKLIKEWLEVRIKEYELIAK